MKMINHRFIILNFLLLFIYSCSVHEDIEVNTDVEYIGIRELNIPEGFDFSTQREVKVVIQDDKEGVKYDVYAYTDEKYFAGIETFQNEKGELVTDSVFKSDVLNKLLFTGKSINGEIEQTVSVPKFYDRLYIRRKDNLKYTASVEYIQDNEVSINTSSKTSRVALSKSSVEEYFYCVNASGDLFQVNHQTGEPVYVSDMPMGSYTCAIDQENRILYSVGRSAPYPLMKYSLDTNQWETVANVGQGGTRLVFNSNDGLLYYSNGRKLYSLSSTTGSLINSWDINGITSSFGGDLEFSEDGTLFLCSFSGIYRLDLDSNNVYQATKINQNLPFLFLPTSLAFDSNNELWVSNFSFNSDLIVVDTNTGDWEYKYGIFAGNGSNIGRSITDLSVLKLDDEVVLPDADGDSVPDGDDAYPNDPEKAFEVYAPSKNGWATLAFEDLWPAMGDNDFNDVALNYKVVTILNADNLVVQVDFVFNVKHNGASFINGFGIELESVSPSQVESVLGNVLSQGYIDLNSNGTEAGQENAVVILFDNARLMKNRQTTTSIKFNQPITTEALGVAPFNPFMIVDETREKEVHLPYGHTTTLGNNNIQIEGHNRDLDGNYVSSIGIPWALNIMYDFKPPKEKVPVNEAYNLFNLWATSGGILHLDWFKELPGYVNSDKIQD